MSDHHPNFHQRKSIRLKGYDYSKAGLYFITMCVQNRECLFGDIRAVGVPDELTVGASLRGRPNISEIQDANMEEKGTHKGVSRQKLVPRQKLDGQNDMRKMILNDAGKMIVKWYNELENKYPEIRCHEMVVMPNHFHCIVEITGECGNNDHDRVGLDHHLGAHVGAPLRGRPDHHPINESVPVSKYGPNNKKFGATIGDVVDWFKTMTTNEYIRGVKNQGWKRFDGKLWQRNYWEHIIRDEGSYDRISEYILQNPSKWIDDQLNPDQKN